MCVAIYVHTVHSFLLSLKTNKNKPFFLIYIKLIETFLILKCKKYNQMVLKDKLGLKEDPHIQNCGEGACN